MESQKEKNVSVFPWRRRKNNRASRRRRIASRRSLLARLAFRASLLHSSERGRKARELAETEAGERNARAGRRARERGFERKKSVGRKFWSAAATKKSVASMLSSALSQSSSQLLLCIIEFLDKSRARPTRLRDLFCSYFVIDDDTLDPQARAQAQKVRGRRGERCCCFCLVGSLLSLLATPDDEGHALATGTTKTSTSSTSPLSLSIKKKHNKTKDNFLPRRLARPALRPRQALRRGAEEETAEEERSRRSRSRRKC